MSLYTKTGERKYLKPSERQAFIDAAMLQPSLQRSFCLMLAYTGCRLSEARNLRKSDLQLDEQLVSIFTLKRRKNTLTREVPIPPNFVQVLHLAHFNALSPSGLYLWGQANEPPPRKTAYRWVKRVMDEAGIHGHQASPKGLRHGFAIHAHRNGIQLNMLQKWMGHANIATTSIYATAAGPEEIELATRMWKGDGV